MADQYQNPQAYASDLPLTKLQKAAVLFTQWMMGELPNGPPPLGGGGGQAIPSNDEQVFEYVAATNNVSNIIYKNAGAEVARQTFEYRAGGAADDDDIVRITLVLP